MRRLPQSSHLGPVGLGRTGAALLRVLSARLGEVVTAEALCEALWPGRSGQERALSVAIHRLRAKLELDPLHPVHLRTVRGEGYLLEVPTPGGPPPPAPPSSAAAGFRLRDGTIDLDAGVVRRGGGAVALTTAELGLLRALVVAGEPVPREVIKVRILGYRSATRTRAVDAALARLRRKIEVDPNAPVHLVTLRHRGIALVQASPPSGRPLAWEQPLIGRAVELAALQRLLTDGRRLVTVTGPPGVGKSRLAAEAVVGLFGSASVRIEARQELLPAVCAALEIAGAGDRAATAGRIGAALAHRGRLALVVDDADDLGAEETATLGRWAEAATALVVVVTGQRRTGLAGEAVLELGPLSAADAMALYEARAADRCVTLEGPAHREAAVALLAAHDHLPLAIELLAGAADGALAVAPPGCAGPLDAALDRAWARLAVGERRALAQATVFAAPFSAQAAAAVLDAPSAVPSLRRASLLRVRPGPEGEVRYELLSTVARFARGRGDPEAVAAATERHTAWAVACARAELDAAIDRGPSSPDPASSAELLAVLARDPAPEVRADAVLGLRHWYRHHDLRDLAEQVAILGDAPLDPDRRALVALLALFVALERAEPLPSAHYAAIADAATEPRFAAGLRFLLGRALAGDGRTAEAAALAATLSEDGARRVRGHGAMLRGLLAMYRGDYVEVQRQMERATVIFREVGSPEEVAVALDGLSLALREGGRLQDAEEALEEAMWRAGEGPVSDLARSKLGMLALARIEPVRARHHFAQALAGARRRGSPGEAVDAQLGDAIAHLDLGNRLQMEARLAEAEQGLLRPGYALEIAVVRALAAVEAGEPEGRAALHALRPAGQPLFEASVALALAWAALAAGAPEEARREAAAGRAALAGTGAWLLADQLRATEAIAAARAGDPEAAEAALAEREIGAPSLAAALVRAARAAVAVARGEARLARRELAGLRAVAPRSVGLRLVLRRP